MQCLNFSFAMSKIFTKINFAFQPVRPENANFLIRMESLRHAANRIFLFQATIYDLKTFFPIRFAGKFLTKHM